MFKKFGLKILEYINKINGALYFDIFFTAFWGADKSNLPPFYQESFGEDFDYQSILRKSFRYIYLLNHEIQNWGTSSSYLITVYRGVKSKVLENTKEKQSFRFENFQSTSLLASVAASFIKDYDKDCTFYTIEIPKRCPNACQIEHSVFEYEKEYLISPHSTYKLVKIGYIPQELYKSQEGRAIVNNKNCKFYLLRLNTHKPEEDDDGEYWSNMKNNTKNLGNYETNRSEANLITE